MGQRCCGADIQPVGQRRRVAEGTHPQAVAHGVPDVVRRHGDEEHPRQRAPGVFETSKPHEEAEGEADDGDDGGAVQRGPLGKRDGSLEGQTLTASLLRFKGSVHLRLNLYSFHQLQINKSCRCDQTVLSTTADPALPNHPIL